ncbi:MAG: M6 family metalloprotease domain-containing protein [Sodaliphilus sp.]
MMKRNAFHILKHTLLGALLMLSVLRVGAVPACPDLAKVVQPDGSTLTLALHGDEWFNFHTTTDGYTVVQDADGYYKYALVQNNALVASTVTARDVAMRSAAEQAWLMQEVQPMLLPDAKAISAQRTKRRLHGNTGHYDYKNFRGLVILVAYNDCNFVYDDAQSLFNGMINDHDYQGFMSNATFPELIPYTGSVRDYFYAASAGEFDPVFDVVGPVSIDYSQYDVNQTANAQTIMAAALEAADSLVNYKDYDRDGNSTVDMVYFIFAGGGSNFSGNDSRLLWPHASSIQSKVLDGVSFGRYACSTELYGRPQSAIIDGIGTVCHEFSHVLGVADLYDTDGTGSGGSSLTPGRWSLMAQGSYLNQSRTPCTYSTYERYAAGFLTPQTLTAKGNYTLSPITSSNIGYRLDSNTENEYFILETRKKEGWDAYLPGEGMLVWRVDSTNVDVWENNKVNCNPSHSYYQLLRAGTGTTDSGSDPFPGTSSVTSITNTTTPNLCSWTGRRSNYEITDITRASTGEVTFHLDVKKFATFVEDFEDVELSATGATSAQGKFTNWTLVGSAKVVETGAENAGAGERACGMIRSSELISEGLPWAVNGLSYTFYNPTTSSATVRTYYRQSGSTLWTIMPTDGGLESVTVASGTSTEIAFNMELAEGTQVRIVEYTGNRTALCYVDDITLLTSVEETPLLGDINLDGTVDVSDVTDLINGLLNGDSSEVMDINTDDKVDVSDVTALINLILT